MVDPALLANGVLAAVLSAMLVGAGRAYLRRHRIRVDCRYASGPNWYHVMLHNDGSHPVHVFDVWLERGGKRYNSSEALSMAGDDIPPYRNGDSAFNVTTAVAHLGGDPTRARVRVDGSLRKVYSAPVPPSRT